MLLHLHCEYIVPNKISPLIYFIIPYLSFLHFRTDECDLCIKLPVVSRRQATFRLVKFNSTATESQGVFVIANYGKTNPTKLNDKAIGPVGREYGECTFKSIDG